MDNRPQSKRINYNEQILLASMAKGKTIVTIKALFQNQQVSEIQFLDEGKKDLAVEVRFDCATLVCFFTDNHCRSIFFFMDDVKDIRQYTDFCSETFPYEPILQCWIDVDCLIMVCHETEECSLMILPNDIEN